MSSWKHDGRDCTCVKYQPDDMRIGVVKMTDDNYFCSDCGRYVSKKKWKGGFVEIASKYFVLAGKKIRHGTQMIWKKANECPCCGIKMRTRVYGRSSRLKESLRKLKQRNRELSDESLVLIVRSTNNFKLNHRK